MGLYFKNSDYKKLTKEQFILLGQLADAAGATTIEEADEEARAEVAERCKFLKEEAIKTAEYQKNLQSSFV